MANCPICKSQPLTPTKVRGALVGSGCTNCGGVLLGLVNYRAWRETQDFSIPLDPPGVSKSSVAAANTEHACQCPKCDGVMSKYRFSIDSSAQLDFCFHCEEIWFDQGEWALLDDLSLTDELTQIFTHPWQHALVQEKISRSSQDRWQQRFGDDYQRISDTRDWIIQHPKKSLIIAYINNIARGAE